MASKEDPMKNFCAVGSGSKPAEEFQVEEEVAASMRLQPLPRTFRGRHKLANQETTDADRMYGGLRPCNGSHVLEEEEEDASIDAKRKGGSSSEGGKPAAAEKAGAAGGVKRKGSGSSEGGKPSADEKVDAAGVIGNAKWEEMPLGYVAWLLSQKREDYRVQTLEDDILDDEDDDFYPQELLARRRELILKTQADDEAGKEEFFAFQEWVRDTFECNGRVMIPEGTLRRKQELLHEEWARHPLAKQVLMDEECEEGSHLLEMTGAGGALPSSN
ncbi:hypothetical protein U9M48_039166 [Paspalum notatum var. saurae]|uniref:Uncharacterized protein n=1 Tax=Paspalum notatum var. saurae TaxID=547442 RepID=A0AAQ3XEB6_PASNO